MENSKSEGRAFRDHFATKPGGATGYALLMDAVASGKSGDMGQHLKNVAPHLGEKDKKDIIASGVVHGAEEILKGTRPE